MRACMGAVVLTFAGHGGAAAANCVYGDKGYSAGAQVCFCPSIELRVGAYRIRQDRWRCDAKLGWQKTEETCASISLPDRKLALETLKEIERGSC